MKKQAYTALGILAGFLDGITCPKNTQRNITVNHTCDFDYIKRNLRDILSELEEIAKAVGTNTPKLVSVTKSGSDEEFLTLVRAGACAIGENRPGELARRKLLLDSAGLSTQLHQIGTLQSNKAKIIAPIATLVHSLDSTSLAKELQRQAEKLSITIPVLIEINSACEPQKSGVLPNDAERFLDTLSSFDRLSPVGLMTMGPVVDNPEDIRKYFRLTKKLFDSLHEKYNFGESPVLSMGMSDSYKIAIEEGSTLVRIGRRLFIKN